MNRYPLAALAAISFGQICPAQGAAEPLRDIAYPVCSSLDAASPVPAGDRSENCPVQAGGDPGRLRVHLTAARGRTVLGDFTVEDAFLYNGSFVPEVWSVDPGDTIDLTLTNALTGQTGGVTNIHTHGMIVSPKNAGGTDLSKPLGDNVFVLVDNGDRAGHGHGHAAPASGGMPAGTQKHIPMDRLSRTADYEIAVPGDHPAGVFWYHPHPHGMSSTQVGGGLGGLITVGLPGDYIRLPESHPDMDHQLLMLKDIQVQRATGEANWTLTGGLDWDLCYDADGTVDRAIPGGCMNGDDRAWLFPVNGQLYPEIEIDEGRPHLWRIANTSANVTHRLELVETRPDGTERILPFQVVSVDGVAVGQNENDGIMRRDSLLMMPSARIEVYVAYDDGTGRTVPDGGAKAVFRQAGFLTGAKPGEGNTLPPVDLAAVTFNPRADPDSPPAPHFVAVEGSGYPGGETVTATSGNADCPRLAPGQSRLVVFDVKSYPVSMTPGTDFPVPPSCQAVRYDRYWFNIMGTAIATVPDDASYDAVMDAYDAAIGMKYAGEVAGKPVATRGKCFDETLDTCVPYPSLETWWVANPSDEAHNFHIHQTRFQVLDVVGADSDFTPAPNVYHDNYPVLAGQAVKVRIPFDRPEQVGTFMYHCHILDHEDEGMMAAIEVRDIAE